MPQLHLVLPAPRLPTRSGSGRASALVTTSLYVAAAVVFALFAPGPQPVGGHAAATPTPRDIVEVPQHMVFLQMPGPGGGGGGGGNRQPAPPSRAQAIGHDRITLPAARPAPIEATPAGPEAGQLVVLDAVPLASGAAYRMGMPQAHSSLPFSLGPGTGGGVGEGTGTGIGAGTGPGLGRGTGGGFGGGVYRPGNGVTAPTIRSQVSPKYTSDAMQRRIQGTVVVEMIVGADGVPYDLRVVRSLDANGLDVEAVNAARQWRFNPGRFGETPVDVRVLVVIDFHMR